MPGARAYLGIRSDHPNMAFTALKIDTSTRTDADASTAPTRAEIHLDALRFNLEIFRRTAPSADVMAVVKADAYGHGSPQVASALFEAGVTHFAVATVPEGVRLRKAGIEGRILVLAAPLPEYLSAYPEHDLDVTVSSEAVARWLTAPGEGPFRAHVKIDTGMGRIGVAPSEAEQIVLELERSSNVKVDGLWTHLATADDEDNRFSVEQIERFRRIIAPLEDSARRIHVANSAAALRIPDSTAFPRAMMRIGIGLYGYSALGGLAEDAGLRPVLRWTSRLTHLKWVDPGTSISYGRRWKADRRTRIATVGAGYADGYPRKLSNRGEVTIGDKRHPVVGTVCMDMFMVDVGTEVDLAIGDDVVLIGPESPDAFEVSAWAETIPYEILTGIAARVPRLYVE